MFHITEYCLSDVEDMDKLKFFIAFMINEIEHNKTVFLWLNSKTDYEILRILNDIYKINFPEYRLRIEVMGI